MFASSRASRSASLLAAVTALASCSDDERVYIMHRIHVTDSGVTKFAGGGCTEIADGVTTGGGTRGLELTFRGMGDGVHVTIRAGAIVEQRSFDQSWLQGNEPAANVRVGASSEYRVELFGGSSCVPPGEPDP